MLDRRSWRIKQVLGRAIDTAHFSLLDTAGTLPSMPDGKEVIVEKYGDATVRYFGGIVAQSDEWIDASRAGLKRALSLDCQDYTVMLDKAYTPPKLYLVADYANDKAIAAAAFTAAMTDPLTALDINDFDVTTYFEVGRVVQSLTLNRMTLRDFMDLLAGNAAYEWYVDYFKKVHYYFITSQRAAYDLSDDPDESTTFAYSDLHRIKDAFGLANVIEVVGGWTLSDAAEETIAGDASAVRFGTKYIWQALTGETLPQVYKNTGTLGTPVWTQQTVAREGDANAGSVNVIWNALQKTLTFATAPANLANAVRVNGRYQVRVYERLSVRESFTTYGRWYWHKIIDPNIFTLQEARIRAQREARIRAFGVKTLRCKVTRDGLRVGDRIRVTNSILSISAEWYIIESIVMNGLGGTLVNYELTLREPFFD